MERDIGNFPIQLWKMAAGSGRPVVVVDSVAYCSASLLDNPIRFVSATCEIDNSKGVNRSRPSSTDVNKRDKQLDGEEAFTFYTSLVRPPETNQDCDSNRKTDSTDLCVRRQNRKPKAATLFTGSKKFHQPCSISDLFTFAQEGRLRELKEFVRTTKNFDIDYQDMHGWTILMTAACAGHLDIVDYLLTRGADVGRTDKKGRNVISVAVAAGQLEIVEWIQTKASNSLTCQRSVAGSKSSSRRMSPFHCSVCDLDVRDALEHRHAHSILHQFNGQPRPGVHAYGIAPSNRGYQLLLDRGWDPSRGLGSESEGLRFPVKTVLKTDRLGLGAGGSSGARARARVTHFGPGDVSAVEHPKRRKLNDSGQTSSLDSALAKRQDKKSRHRQAEVLRLKEAEMRRYFNSD